MHPRRSNSSLLVVLLLVLLGCKQLDEVRGKAEASAVAAQASAAPSAAAAGPAAPDGPSGTTPLPLAVGQWVKYKTTNNGAATGHITYRITGMEGSAHWISLDVNDTKSGDTSIQMLIDFQGKRSYDALKVQKAKIKLPTGQEHTLSGILLDRSVKAFGGQLAGLALDNLAGLPTEDVKVAAGSFPGSYYRDYDVKVYTIHSKGRVWHHTRVPISAMVKNEGTASGSKVGFELVAFGTQPEPQAP